MSETTIADMIGFAADKQPEAFNKAFNDVMMDKVVAALDAKKQEVAASYFNASAEEELEDSNEEENGQDAETDA